MKKTIIYAAFLATASSLSAATYTIGNNLLGSDANQLTDSSGTLLIDTNGSIAFGTFTSDSDVTSALSSSELFDEAIWSEFGTNETTFSGTSPVVGSGLAEAEGISLDTDFNNKHIYMVVGNATDLASASEFFIYKFDTFFANVDTSATVNVTLGSDSGTIIVGNVGPEITNAGFVQTANFSFQTADIAAVPEPSSTALLGLGAVGFLLRRRRQA